MSAGAFKPDAVQLGSLTALEMVAAVCARAGRLAPNMSNAQPIELQYFIRVSGLFSKLGCPCVIRLSKIADAYQIVE
jgi:hypothetical protein